MSLKVKILVPGAKPPCRGYPGSVGYDLYSIESGSIDPGKCSGLIRTGIATEFDSDLAALVFDRGSTGMQGIIRRAGVIDPDFRNEWLVLLYNASEKLFHYESILENPKAKAIAQVVFCKIGLPEVLLVETLTESQRGMNFGGSTNK